MVKPLNFYPNPILFKKSAKCLPSSSGLTRFLEDEKSLEKSLWERGLEDHIHDLIETAESLGTNCVGLSSCQIWDIPTPAKSVFIIKIPKSNNLNDYTWQEFINPIVTTSGNKIKFQEKCMSIPNYVGNTKREMNATIKFQTLQNLEYQTLKFFGKQSLMPVILQHEYDHILGRTIHK